MYPRKQVMEMSLLVDRFSSSFLLHPYEDLRAIILVFIQTNKHILDFVSRIKS